MNDIGRTAGRIRSRLHACSLLPAAGALALLWFLVRVVPKPARASYPCQRVSAPMASGFVVWLLGIAGSAAVLRHARARFRRARYAVGAASLVFAGLLFAYATIDTSTPALAQPAPLAAPIGEAKGIHPGRVTWAYDPGATNEAATNVEGDYWWNDKNTDQAVVDAMVSDSLRQLTGKTTDATAWDALFCYHNKVRRGINAGYATGETIVIKVNLTSGFAMAKPGSDAGPPDGGSYTQGVYAAEGDLRDLPNTSPQIMRSVLKQLVGIGVTQDMIYIGDPNRPFFDQYFDMIRPQFPRVHYLDRWGLSGRTLATPTENDVLFYSDKVAPPAGAGSDKIPQAFVDATYLINIAVLKGHENAGATLGAKNHFGTQCRAGEWYPDQGWAYHLHYSHPDSNPGYGQYRVLVDLMGHKDIGGKTVLTILDGLWGGYKSTPAVPNKWKSAPFNDDWPSSVLMSQDIVAIDAVGLDFLKEEYQAANGYARDHQYPNAIDGVDDYLFQAADPTKWPKTAGGTAFGGYDPENDGTLLGSLGVFERWNNPADKKYSRNIDPIRGTGIELVKLGRAGSDAGAPSDAGPALDAARADANADGAESGPESDAQEAADVTMAADADAASDVAIVADAEVAADAQEDVDPPADVDATATGDAAGTQPEGSAGSAPNVPGDEGGCSCSTAGTSRSSAPAAGAALLALASALRRRRRRQHAQ